MSELPPLPEWSKCDDLGGLVPSEIRQELTAYARAAVQAAQPEAVGEVCKALIRAWELGQVYAQQAHSEARSLETHTAFVALLDKTRAMLASAPTEPMSAPTAEPVAEIGSFDEYGPCFNWFTHWTKFAVGTKFYAQQPANPRKADDVDLLLRAVFELCEATEEAPEVEPKNEHQRGFDKGRRFEAKAIRRSVGDWFQATFCGQSFMGEPVLTKPGVAHCIDGACHLCATPPSAATPEPSDAERLDWLETADWAMVQDQLQLWFDLPTCWKPATVRAAIDAAIRATKGGKL